MSTEKEAHAPKGILGRIGRGFAILAVLALGGMAAAAIVSYEPKLPETETDHDHGGHSHAQGGHEHGENGHGEEGHAEGEHGGEDHAEPITLTPQQRQNANLTVEPVDGGTIRQTLTLNGIILPNEEKTVAVLPRFGGIVRAMNKRLGETVKKGEVVARIESNESLTQYDIQAPIGGVVIERSGTLGEFAASDKRLLVISDLREVWVDLRVYSADFDKLKVGQHVEISLPGHAEPHAATISYVSPIGVTDTQSMLARAVVPNEDRGFLPGLFVTGRVVVGEQAAAAVVPKSAVQYIDGKPVVFVEEGEGFEKREVELGARDDTVIEVRTGVAPGEKVVTENSFILKAELGKGEAEHVH